MPKGLGKCLLVLVFSVGFYCQAGAKNYGVRGAVKPVIEADMLEQINAKFAEMEKSGELADITDDMIEASKKNADRPAVYHELPRAKKPRAWSFDPSFTLKKNIFDAENRLIAKAGTTVNPLEYVGLGQSLLFINADDKAQLDFAKNWYDKLQGQIKLVLTRGSINKTTQFIDGPVYFDQKGLLVERFDIRALPVTVEQSQDGRRLSLREVVL